MSPINEPFLGTPIDGNPQMTNRNHHYDEAECGELNLFNHMRLGWRDFIKMGQFALIWQSEKWVSVSLHHQQQKWTVHIRKDVIQFHPKFNGFTVVLRKNWSISRKCWCPIFGCICLTQRVTGKQRWARHITLEYAPCPLDIDGRQNFVQ